MEEDVFFGINESNIDQLSIEIINFSDRIADIIERIDDIFSELSADYKGTPFNQTINKYESFRKNYKTLKDNLTSYSEDYLALSRKIKEGTVQVALKVLDDSDELSRKTKSIS